MEVCIQSMPLHPPLVSNNIQLSHSRGKIIVLLTKASLVNANFINSFLFNNEDIEVVNTNNVKFPIKRHGIESNKNKSKKSYLLMSFVDLDSVSWSLPNFHT